MQHNQEQRSVLVKGQCTVKKRDRKAETGLSCNHASVSECLNGLGGLYTSAANAYVAQNQYAERCRRCGRGIRTE